MAFNPAIVAESSFHVLLHARNSSLGVARSYRLTLSRDLFGAWVVELQHGRIGTRGRVRLLAFDDEASARSEIRGRLKRRTTAPKRIGASYHTVSRESAPWMEGV